MFDIFDGNIDLFDEILNTAITSKQYAFWNWR